MDTLLGAFTMTISFNLIARRYDFLNRVLSLGIDKYWRSYVVSNLPKSSNLHILDVATGTGDLALAMARANQNVVSVTGVDIADDMMALGREKIEHLGFSALIDLQHGNAENLHFQDSSFNAVTISFGLRNVRDKIKALSEMKRVLKPGGRLMVLEFSLPRNWLIRTLYLFYFRHVLPWIGGLISGNYEAYQYLNKSVEQFDASIMDDMKQIPLSFGIATLYVFDKMA